MKRKPIKRKPRWHFIREEEFRSEDPRVFCGLPLRPGMNWTEIPGHVTCYRCLKAYVVEEDRRLKEEGR